MHAHSLKESDRTTETVPWGAVLAMSLSAFVLVSSEFMPVSLLTPIATDLSMTEGQAGQVISVSGIFAVVTSLFISSLVRGLDRKSLLLGLSALTVLSGFLVAVAPNYWAMMIGRALLGIAIGGTWSMSTAVITRMVSGSFVPRAIALLQSGSALATAVAAPMGSFMGGLVGWRGAFFCVVPLAALALVWQAFTLPSLPGGKTSTPGNVLHLLSKPIVVFGMVAVALMFMGQFALFTYLRPFLENVTHVDIAGLSFALLAIGAFGLAGTTLIGYVLNDRLPVILIVVPLIMAVIAVSLVAFGSSYGVTLFLLAIWGLVATPAPVAWFTWLSRTLPEDMEAGGGLMVAVIQFAITGGATVGGILFDSAGYKATFGAAACLLVLATVISVLVSRRRT